MVSSYDYNVTDNTSQCAELPKGEGQIKSILQPIAVALALMNILMNIINAIVFIKIRFADVVTICLFVLSIADGLSSFIGGFSSLCNCLRTSTIGPNVQRYIDLDNIFGFVTPFCFVTVSISNNVTTLCAIERCLIVAVPLKAKRMITIQRAWIIIACLVIFSVLFNSPLYMTARVVRRFNTRLNVTRLEIVFTSDRQTVVNTLQSITYLAFGTISVISVMVTSHIMVRGLKRSSRFRNVMVAADRGSVNTTNRPRITSVDSNGDLGCSLNSTSEGTASVQISGGSSTNTTVSCETNKLSDKNVRLIKMLLILSISTGVIQFCMVIIATGSWIEPDFSVIGCYSYEFSLIVLAFQYLSALNQSINIFLYYHYNKKFKKVFQDMFSITTCSHRCRNQGQHQLENNSQNSV